MLRYETEFTPCTGITAVTKQERRHFHRGIMIAPWCPKLKREKPEEDPIEKGTVQSTNWKFPVNGKTCRVLATTDDFTPILFLGIEGRFEGIETPYDVPLQTLKEDTLYFGLAVDQWLKNAGSPRQFVWGADWETVPALHLVRDRHPISLTLHNTFDECLDPESRPFNSYRVFSKEINAIRAKTALEIGLEIADVVTAVNRGFAHGLRAEPLQQKVMAKHLQHLLGRVVGINNAAFAPLNSSLLDLKKKLLSDFASGRDDLFRIQSEARKALPDEIKNRAANKVMVVSMGRRVSQKQHDVLVESVRHILHKDKTFPLLVVFATVHGDAGSPARLDRMRKLEKEFPSNVVCMDGRVSYYQTLMAAADYNCMPSLYEPHGGAYEGAVIPIARAIDGLAEQICALHPKGNAIKMNTTWHAKDELPTGFLFREHDPVNPSQGITDLTALVEESPSPENSIFIAMRDSLSELLRDATRLRLDEPDAYARLVLAALEKQESLNWHQNLGGMIALVEEARTKRTVSQASGAATQSFHADNARAP